MKITDEMRKCIENCVACHSGCVETTRHCLTRGGAHATPEHIMWLMDCAEICETSADFLLRGSERHPETCRICADICKRCADNCRRLADGDDVMLRCADLCTACAASCTAMAGAAVFA